MGIGQREAWNFRAFGETRQVITFLLLGPVVPQQFAGPQRVGNHHGDDHRAAARSELGDDLRVRERREAQTSVLLRDDHAEKALVLDELPNGCRQILVDVRRFPIAHHAAKLFTFVVEETLLVSAELRRGKREKRLPIGPPREKLAVPANGPGFDRLAFGRRHRRKDPAEDPQNAVADQRAAERRHVERDRQYDQQDRQHDHHQRWKEVRFPRGGKRECNRTGPPPARRVHVGQREKAADDGQNPDDCECQHRDS